MRGLKLLICLIILTMKSLKQARFIPQALTYQFSVFLRGNRPTNEFGNFRPRLFWYCYHWDQWNPSSPSKLHTCYRKSENLWVQLGYILHSWRQLVRSAPWEATLGYAPLGILCSKTLLGTKTIASLRILATTTLSRRLGKARINVVLEFNIEAHK